MERGLVEPILRVCHSRTDANPNMVGAARNALGDSSTKFCRVRLLASPHYPPSSNGSLSFETTCSCSFCRSDWGVVKRWKSSCSTGVRYRPRFCSGSVCNGPLRSSDTGVCYISAHRAAPSYPARLKSDSGVTERSVLSLCKSKHEKDNKPHLLLARNRPESKARRRTQSRGSISAYLRTHMPAGLGLLPSLPPLRLDRSGSTPPLAGLGAVWCPRWPCPPSRHRLQRLTCTGLRRLSALRETRSLAFLATQRGPEPVPRGRLW